ncbi:DEAD/DEAH box helicase [Lapidilactobacillus gannanensis]|jgi:ATP-dependent RNA helicase CshB|uniref:DEAD-box ATP-dependent RNA helicase CshB n=1 Tax=Lapidilactobacillus gannanensis TaxID=2486002 RepID=A0ABW4BKZ2_9LACO|nr:DEAD/DEAH box helicase [Lapidilactobacillus gannanensis]MCH4056513.1 DEAD/DEAH box helicase [Lactobacillaceae bacterium]
MSENFTGFNLSSALQSGLAKIKFQVPTKVQATVIPILLAGRDAIVQSETGSGKTHAFLLPLIEQLEKGDDLPQIVITSPSRELANQTYLAARKLIEASELPWRTHLYVGGSDKERQIEKLRRQQPDIVVGTPGRILDLVSSSALRVDQVRFLVIDEADMTLDMGFLKDVDAVASKMPTGLQMAVFSATIPDKLQPFLKKYLSNPAEVDLTPKTIINPNVENWLFASQGRDKVKLVEKILNVGQPYLALIFANTKEEVDEITIKLQQSGLKVAKIHGGLQPRERKRVMKQIENLEFQYVVATDLAARGIDIPGVSLIINFNIPRDLEFFIHRVGRTGRNGLDGTAITLYSPEEEGRVHQLEKLGINFIPKTLHDGQIVTSYDRRRREQRTATHDRLDPNMIGYVKKQHRKVKPGYKKKIKQAINDDRRRKKKIAERVERNLHKKQKRQRG